MLSVENTWKELRDAGVDIAVVSVGSIEQHGHHLPLGTDWFIAEAHARALAERLGAYLLPTMPFGNSREHMAFPGTITLRPATLAAVLEDLVESLRHHGITKIVVLSSHGGNWIIKPTIRELNFKYPELSLVWASGPRPEAGDAVPQETHAGEGETSAMLQVRPDLVKHPEDQPDSPGIVGQEFNDYVGYDRTTRTGAWGFPARASTDAGRERFEQAVERSAGYVEWAFRRVAELRAGPSIIDAPEGSADEEN